MLTLTELACTAPEADGGSDGYISAGGCRITYGHTIAYRCANFVTNGEGHGHCNTGTNANQHVGSADVHAGSYIYAQAAAYGYAAARSYQHARADAYREADAATHRHTITHSDQETDTRSHASLS